MRWLAVVALCACGGAPPNAGPGPGGSASALPPVPPTGFVHHEGLPAEGKLAAAWQIAPDDVWAVDDHDVALHWDGRAWTTAFNRGRCLHCVPFRSVWASGHDDVWIVAARGSALHRGGDYESFVPAANELWHWDGHAWAAFALPDLGGNAVLGGMSGSGPNDVWIAVHTISRDGRGHDPEHATALHWNGRRLATVTFDGAHSTRSPWVISATDAWIVTEKDDMHDEAALWHWDGTRWSQDRTIARASEVWADGDGLWVSASRVLYHRDRANKWTSAPLHVHSIRATPTVWGIEDRRPMVWTHGDWHAAPAPPGVDASLGAGSPTDPWWFGTRNGMPAAARDQQVFAGPVDGAVTAMSFATADEGWAIAHVWDVYHDHDRHEVVRWRNGAWRSVAVPPPFVPQAVWAMPGRAWIAGSHGELAIGDGASWRTMPAIGTNELTSFWGTVNDLWVAGCGGSVAHWDGSAWQQTPIGIPAEHGGICLSLGGSGPSDVWAVGIQENVFHWDGHAWTRVTFDVDGLFHDPGGSGFRFEAKAVWAASARDVWIVGGGAQPSQPLLLHYDGIAWSRTLMPRDLERERREHGTDHGMSSIWGRAGNDIWAAGESGDVLHYDGTTWSRIAASHDDHRGLFVVTGTAGGPVWFGGEVGALVSLAPNAPFAPVVDSTPKVPPCPAQLAEVNKDWWLAGDAACPSDAHLEGAPPPQGKRVRCVTAAGVPHGPETEFWESGGRQREGTFDHGHQFGVFTHYSERGIKTDVYGACGSKRHGPYARYNDRGQRLSQGQFVDGLLDGTITAWARDGRVLGKFTFTRGTGHMTTWYDDGVKQNEGDYVDGKQDGEWTSYWGAGGPNPAGLKMEQGTYKAGVRSGTWSEWSPAGKPVSRGDYIDGVREGKWTWWDPAGRAKTIEFVHGLLRHSADASAK